MCDVHLCDDMIHEMFEMGPLWIILEAPEQAVAHLLSCEECAKKLVDLIRLSQAEPMSEQIM